MKLITDTNRYFKRFQANAIDRMAPSASAALEKDSLAYWRVRILFAIIFSGLLIGVFTLVPVIVMLVRQQMWALLIFDIATWLLGIFLLLARGPSYEIRTAITLSMFYLVGVVIIVSIGPLSGGPAWIFAYAVLVGVLLGSRAAIKALILNALTLSMIGWAFHTGLLGGTSLHFNSIEHMLTAGANFMLLNAIAAMSVAVLVKGLIAAHQKERDASRTLKRERLHLIETKHELESEVEDRKQAENALRTSEKKHRKLVSNISDVIVILNKEGIVTYKSPNITEQFGWYPEDLIGKHGLTTVSLSDQERIGNELASILIKDKEKITVEFEYRCKDGRTKPVELKAVNMMNDPVINGVLANYRDITERKSTERILKQSEEKYRTMIDRSNDMIWTIDTQGNFTFFNKQTEDVTGLNLKEWVGKSFVSLVLEEDLPMIRDIFEKGLKGESAQYRLRVRDHENKILTIRVNMAPLLMDGTVSGLVSFGRDITEKQLAEEEKANLEAQLQQAQKMESIGTLAGGIAHDFNNILFPMFGYLEMALEDVPDDSPVRGKLAEVLNGALRARDLVQQILTFSRQTEHEKKPLKVQLVIHEVLKLLHSTLPATIDIRQDISHSCEAIMADPTQIHQIAMNLMTNAYHAMEESGGTLRIGLKQVELAIENLKDAAMVPGPYVCLTVADTGPGMDQGTIARIFDPYFTTKKEGKGTGLGLAVVHGIVKSYGGHISVFSEPGKKTEFTVYLPVIKPQRTTRKIEVDAPIQKGVERILLVDDQDVIVQMIKQMLERLGYHVTARTSSLDALEAFRAHPDTFDLVITDMTMPNMTGDKLAGEMIKIRSDIPVILCTGFSEGMSEERATSIGIKGFLMKPVVMKALSSAIRSALDI